MCAINNLCVFGLAIFIADARGGEPEVLSIPSKDPTVFSLSFTPDGEKLAVGGYKGSPRIVLWDVATLKEGAAFRPGNGAVYSVAVSSNGQMIATGEADNVATLWAPDGKLLFELRHPSPVSSVKFAPDGSFVATGTLRGPCVVRIWDVHSGQQMREFIPEPRLMDASLTVALSHDQSMLAASCAVYGPGSEQYVWVWDLATGKQRWTFGDGANGVVFTPDGKTLIATSVMKQTIYFYDLATGKLRLTIPHASYGAVALSPGGELLYVDGARDDHIHVFDTSSGKERGVFPEKMSGIVMRLALSPDGRTLAWCGDGKGQGAVRLLRLPEALRR
jgi:WD40 repeat protein